VTMSSKKLKLSTAAANAGDAHSPTRVMDRKKPSLSAVASPRSSSQAMDSTHDSPSADPSTSSPSEGEIAGNENHTPNVGSAMSPPNHSEAYHYKSHLDLGLREVVHRSRLGTTALAY
jgi:hypothetical protein